MPTIYYNEKKAKIWFEYMLNVFSLQVYNFYTIYNQHEYFYIMCYDHFCGNILKHQNKCIAFNRLCKSKPQGTQEIIMFIKDSVHYYIYI